MVSMFTCRGCNIEFTPKRKGQEYHNRDCFLKSTLKFYNCPECGIKFRKKFSKQTCCSPECSFSYRAKKNTKGKSIPCSFDGKPVYKMQSRVRKDNFCDDVCKIAWLRGDKNPYKKRKHTPEEIEKIRQAGYDRDYSKVFTEKTRQKFRVNAKNTILRPEVMEKTRQLNRERMTGSKLSEETKQKIKLKARYGKDNNMWKETPSNPAIHEWAKKNLPLPKICVEYDPTGNNPCSKQIEASSIGNLHLRDIANWEWRCVIHHDRYELQYGLVNPRGKIARVYSKYGPLRKRSITMDAIIIERNDMRFASNY